MTSVLRRIQYHLYGGLEVLRLEEFEPSAPGRGQCSYAYTQPPRNAMDWKIRNGELRPMTGRRFPPRARYRCRRSHPPDGAEE